MPPSDVWRLLGCGPSEEDGFELLSDRYRREGPRGEEFYGLAYTNGIIPVLGELHPGLG
jgi:hypothetical protein